MSKPLPVRVKLLRGRLERLDQLGASVKEAALLDDLRSDLEPPVVELKKALDQCALLSASDIAVKEPASLKSARKRALDLLEKFKSERTAATLKKGVGWINLVRDIEEASKELVAVMGISWKAYRQEVFTGEAPAVIKGRIAFTSSNSAAFKVYEQQYQEFRACFERLPPDIIAVEKARSIAAALTKTANEFDYDVPADVKLFLEAVQSGGAPLNLLNDTVKDWLTSNGAYESYRVLPRSTNASR